jgi:peroxiredoxin
VFAYAEVAEMAVAPRFSRKPQFCTGFNSDIISCNDTLKILYMHQAEVGSAQLTPAHRTPSRGHLMPDFTLPSTEGKQIGLYDYRGRSGLVLFFAADADHPEEQRLIDNLGEHYAEIREQDSEVLIVVTCSREQVEEIKRQARLLFPVLLDREAQVHKIVGALGHQSVPAPAVYVTDRFMEVFAAWLTGAGGTLPSISDVLSWLAYLDSVCPECTQVEWPREK